MNSGGRVHSRVFLSVATRTIWITGREKKGSVSKPTA